MVAPLSFRLLATECYRPSRRSCPTGIRPAASRISIGPMMPAAPCQRRTAGSWEASAAPPAAVTTPADEDRMVQIDRVGGPSDPFHQAHPLSGSSCSAQRPADMPIRRLQCGSIRNRIDRRELARKDDVTMTGPELTMKHSDAVDQCSARLQRHRDTGVPRDPTGRTAGGTWRGEGRGQVSPSSGP